MFDLIYGLSSQFDTGALVAHARTGVAGVVTKVYYDEMAGQFVYVVRVPCVPAPFPVWGEDAVVASASAHAVAVGDLLIVQDRCGGQAMGQIIGKRESKLICRMADGDYLVGMSRVRRVMPASLVRFAVARLAVAS